MAGDGFWCTQVHTHHVLLPRLNLGPVVAGWKASGVTSVVWLVPGLAISSCPSTLEWARTAGGGSGSTEKALNTSQVSRKWIKHGSHIVLQEDWPKNPLLKVVVGHLIMRRIEFYLIFHLSDIPSPCLDCSYSSTPHVWWLPHVICVFKHRPLKKKWPHMVFIQLYENI